MVSRQGWFGPFADYIKTRTSSTSEDLATVRYVDRTERVDPTSEARDDGCRASQSQLSFRCQLEGGNIPTRVTASLYGLSSPKAGETHTLPSF